MRRPGVSEVVVGRGPPPGPRGGAAAGRGLRVRTRAPRTGMLGSILPRPGRGGRAGGATRCSCTRSTIRWWRRGPSTGWWRRSGAGRASRSPAGRDGAATPAASRRAAWAALRAAPAARGARAVLADHPDWVVHVPGDAGCVAGIDTPEDYARLDRSARPDVVRFGFSPAVSGRTGAHDSSQRRHHRPRRPRQDHPRGRPAPPGRSLPRQPGDGRARHGLERPRARARHHDPGQEHRRALRRGQDQHRGHARATPTSAARSSARSRWSTASCCWWTRPRGPCPRRATCCARRWRRSCPPCWSSTRSTGRTRGRRRC